MSIIDKLSDALKGETPVDALDYLEHQHREVEDLFSNYEDLGGSAFKSKEKVFVQIYHNLMCHMKVEESLLYSNKKIVEGENAKEALEEHAVAKAQLEKIMATSPDKDNSYDTKVHVLKELIEHHVKEEEKKFFPVIRKKTTDDFRHELGLEIKAMFEKIMAKTIKE